jgi:hypothetical protein
MKMKLHHAAALAVVWYLMMPAPLRATDDSIAVPGTADVETGPWYLLLPPDHPLIVPVPPGGTPAVTDLTAPLLAVDNDQDFPYREAMPRRGERCSGGISVQKRQRSSRADGL